MKYGMDWNYICLRYAEKSMILPVQESEICHLDFHPESQPRNVLKMFLGFQEIEPIVLINMFLYKNLSMMAYLSRRNRSQKVC